MLGDNRYCIIVSNCSHSIQIRSNIVQALVSFLGLNQRDTALSNSVSHNPFVFSNVYDFSVSVLHSAMAISDNFHPPSVFDYKLTSGYQYTYFPPPRNYRQGDKLFHYTLFSANISGVFI
jgi:hypothetical protein